METFNLGCLVFAALAELWPHNFASLLTTVLQGSVHPGLSPGEAAQRAGGGAEDGLRGTQEPRVVPWSDTPTGNTQDGRRERKERVDTLGGAAVATRASI